MKKLKKTEKKICVILTGGTICSTPDENGKNQSNAEKTSTYLTEDYLKESDSPFKNDVTFDFKKLKTDVLSENMTVGMWNDIINIFKKIDFNKYEGIIVLHGTDTLAYTSAFLSFALAGIPVPVCMVSSQLRLGQIDEYGVWHRNKKTNGYQNFRAAVELIVNGIAPNVYVVYKNVEDEHNKKRDSEGFFVHYGSHLLQCPNSSNNFHSRDEMVIGNTTCASLKGKEFESHDCLYLKMKKLGKSVLLLNPYTNLDYSAVKLNGYKSVIHGTYHSESVCIGRPITKDKTKPERDDYTLDEITKADRPYSILYLLSKCSEKNIPVFLAPCDKNNAQYSTTANACKAGAIPICSSDITLEAAYAKAVLGCALCKQGDELVEFLQQSINYDI